MARDLTLSEKILEQVVAQVGGTVVDVPKIPSPLPPGDHLRAKEMECEVLRLNLAKEINLRATLEQDCN